MTCSIMLSVVKLIHYIHVPATSANLGPGFDCLGLALDLWNYVRVDVDSSGPAGLHYHASGEGADFLNDSPSNLLSESFLRVFEICAQKLPASVSIFAQNEIPLGSGLGSSAAAIVGGLAAGNAVLGNPLDEAALLKIATDIEGHPDNVAPAILGGLTAAVGDGQEVIARRFDLPPLTLVIVKPEVELSTKSARAVLPESVSRCDAVFNIGRAVLVTEALRAGDLSLLARVMEDRLHQSYRLKHIPGGEAAYLAAKGCGAVALSGAGPSLVAFVEASEAEKVKGLMMAAFGESGVGCRAFVTRPSEKGVWTA
ncbi:MAG: homoserine kinase [Anaerolineales bacterium]